jgi:hypothetical protein
MSGYLPHTEGDREAMLKAITMFQKRAASRNLTCPMASLS